jgi:acetyltransferase-like isoleucine patch superfamily enzyme
MNRSTPMSDSTFDRPSPLRTVVLLVAALMPSPITVAIYRHVLRYRVGRGVRIGVSIVHAGDCAIGDDAVIGHGNVIVRVGRLVIGDHVRIGHLNLIRGGREVRLERYSELLRLNQLNSIPDAEVVDGTADPRLIVGPGCVVTSGHKIDFTDRVELGRRVIVGGRNSSLWTHNRQRIAPIVVGAFTYLGSEIRMAPGSSVPAKSIVGIGAVVTDALTGDGCLYGGVPARMIKELDERDRYLVERKTREDLPDDV